MFDVESIRRDFPILQRKVHGKPLVWLDSAATTQKPQAVIDRVSRFYEHENSNIHRGTHTLATESCNAYEGARAKVAAFLGADSPQEIVFVRGTTEGINLLAAIFGEEPVAARRRDRADRGRAPRQHRALAIRREEEPAPSSASLRWTTTATSSSKSTNACSGRAPASSPSPTSPTRSAPSMPIHEMTAMAKRVGATVVIDGAQGIPHRRVDVQAIGCDFYVFSGHKLFAPTGVGVVYGRKELWDEMPPWQGGGGMIEHVTFEKTTFNTPPRRFEAGTPSVSSAVGLGAAIDYLNGIGLAAMERYETELLAYALEGIRSVDGLRVIGMPKERGGVISFVMDGIPDMQVARMLDAEGIAVRTGHHCAQPILARFGLESSVRPSFAFYNTRAEADALVETLRQISQRR